MMPGGGGLLLLFNGTQEVSRKADGCVLHVCTLQILQSAQGLQETGLWTSLEQLTSIFTTPLVFGYWFGVTIMHYGSTLTTSDRI